jgi:hypothetical protein
VVHDRVGLGLEIRLREQDHGFGTALPREREIALEEWDAQVRAERGDDEEDVEVCADDLLTRPFGLGIVGGASGKARAARENCLNRARTGVDRDPVADDRKLASRGCLVANAARDASSYLAVFGQHVVGTTVLNGDASRDEPERALRLECRRPFVVPAERLERGHPGIVMENGDRLARGGPPSIR